MVLRTWNKASMMLVMALVLSHAVAWAQQAETEERELDSTRFRQPMED